MRDEELPRRRAPRPAGGLRRPDQPGRSGRPGRPGNPGRPGLSGRPGESDDHSESRDWFSEPDAYGDSDRPGAAGRSRPRGRHRHAVPAGERPTRRRRRRWPRIVAACLVAVLLAAGGLAFAAWRRLNHLDHNIHRVGALSAAATNRPKVSELAGGAINFLATGNDARAGEVSHSDTVMLIHLNSAHTKAYVISLPRDSWVPITGHGEGKLTWALSYKNGQTVLWQTVETLTNVRIDHYVGIDFGGFQKLVDELGGVDIVVDKDTSDERIHLTAGPHHLNGADALKYVRQRHNLANGDIDRERRQQQFLHAIMVKVSSEGVLTDFGKLNSVAEQVTKNLSADDGFHVLDTAWNLRHLQANDVTYLTVPTATLDYHPAQDPNQSAVQLSSTAGDLWHALANDTVDAWIAAHPQNVTNPDHGV